MILTFNLWFGLREIFPPQSAWKPARVNSGQYQTGSMSTHILIPSSQMLVQVNSWLLRFLFVYYYYCFLYLFFFPFGCHVAPCSLSQFSLGIMTHFLCWGRRFTIIGLAIILIASIMIRLYYYIIFKPLPYLQGQRFHCSTISIAISLFNIMLVKWVKVTKSPFRHLRNQMSTEAAQMYMFSHIISHTIYCLPTWATANSTVNPVISSYKEALL